jgi:hypothetical protein
MRPFPHRCDSYIRSMGSAARAASTEYTVVAPSFPRRHIMAGSESNSVRGRNVVFPEESSFEKDAWKTRVSAPNQR